MNLSRDNDTPIDRTSLIATLSDYFARYRMALYLVFATTVSLSVAWNWNWLTAAEIFRIMASLPCSFMMLMCMKRTACRYPPQQVIFREMSEVSQ
jgi:hypothetical protein